MLGISYKTTTHNHQINNKCSYHIMYQTRLVSRITNSKPSNVSAIQLPQLEWKLQQTQSGTEVPNIKLVCGFKTGFSKARQNSVLVPLKTKQTL